MGTHPIFESDFDCLTECYPNSLARLGVLRRDNCPPRQLCPAKLVQPKLHRFWKNALLVHQPRAIWKRPDKSWPLVTVLPVSMACVTSKPRKWLSSPRVSRVWL